MSPARPARYDLSWRRGNILTLAALCMVCAAALACRAVDRTRAAEASSDIQVDRVAAATQRVDPNTATVASLRRLPSVGPAKARAIVAYRRTHPAAFRTADDLTRVPGIGSGTVARIARHLTVPPAGAK